MENEDKYLEAARIIADCKPSKLPYVLSVLKQGGFDLDRLVNPKTLGASTGINYDCRVSPLKKGKRKSWAETDDKLVLALREANDNGLNISKFAAMSGIGRTSIYKFMSGSESVSPATREKISETLKAIQL